MVDKKSGGIFFERELYLSDAFLDLNKSGILVVLHVLDIRRVEKRTKDRKGVKRKPRFTNLDQLVIPYATLQKKYRLSRPAVKRGINDALAHGFLELEHHGGTFKHDMSVFSWSDKWRFWVKGQVFSELPQDVKRGFQGAGKGAVAKNTRTQNVTHTQTRNVTLTG